ncbi:unnamed protein product [Calypogeia fissa]
MMPVVDHLEMEREAGDFLECSTSLPADEDMDNYMPWEWILENLLDVKEISLPFFKEIIEYAQPHIEQPQCSRLLQKVALRYLDEQAEKIAASERELDLCDVVFLKFLLKEQGVSNLRTRIHSLKESFQNNLILRVETEAVLTNLRCGGNEGRGIDWAAFEYALDSVFPKDVLEPREAERRKELTAILQSKGEPEQQICKQLLRKYPLEELCSDLRRFVDDKRKSFKIKFLEQVAEDVETGVYSFPQLSESPEPGSGRALTGSTPAPGQTEKHIAIQEDGDTVAAGPRVSKAEATREEMSLGMADVDEIAKGFTEEMKEIESVMTTFTEVVQHTASMPVLSPDLNNQQVFNLGAPIAGNSVSLQQKCVVICPSKEAEGHLDIEPVEDQRDNIPSADDRRSESFKRFTDGDMQQTSRISPGKRLGNEIIDQVSAVAKKTKFNDAEEISAEQRNQSGAAGCRVRSVMQSTSGELPSKDRLSSEDVDTALPRVLENCNVIDKQVGNISSAKDGQLSNNGPALTSGESNLPVAYSGNLEFNAKCCFCGSNDGRQAFCHRCPLAIHESCLSNLCSAQVEVENSWYCFVCAATMAEENLRRAQELVRKAEEAVLTTQERLSTFVLARRERSRQHHEGQNSVADSQGNLCEYVPETPDESIISLHANRDSREDSRTNPEVEDETISPKSGILRETRVQSSGSTLQNVMDEDMIRQSSRTAQYTKMSTGPQVVSEELNADQGPGEDLPREAIGGRSSTAAPSLSVSQVLRPGDCGQEQCEGPRSPADTIAPMISDANQSHEKSGPNDLFIEVVEATNVATNGSEVPVDRAGQATNVATSGSEAPVDRAGDATNVATNGSEVPVDRAGQATNVATSGSEAPEDRAGDATNGLDVPVDRAGEATNVATDGSEVPLDLSGEATNVLTNGSEVPVDLAGEATNVAENGSEVPVDRAGEATNVATNGSEVPLHRAGEATDVATSGSEVPVDRAGEAPMPSEVAVDRTGHSSPLRDVHYSGNLAGEGDEQDGNLEKVSEGNRAAGDNIGVAEPAVVEIIEEGSVARNVRAHLRPRKVYRGRGRVPGVRRQNLPWNSIEEDALKEGVKMFSNKGERGFQWKRILEFGAGKFHESRTTVDLKDKWRNLRSKQV